MSFRAKYELEKLLKKDIDHPSPFATALGMQLYVDRANILESTEYIIGPPELIRQLVDLTEQAAKGCEGSRIIATKWIESARRKSDESLGIPSVD